MTIITTTPKFACLVCGRVSTTRRCEQHGATNKRPSFSQRGYGKQFKTSRTRLLEDHPTCCVDGCQEPATIAHHSPKRTVLVAMNVANPDDISWLKGMCHHHHASLSARGR